MSSSDDEELYDLDDDIINDQKNIEESIKQMNDDFETALEVSQAENIQRIRTKVTDRINAIFGDDLNNLFKVNELQRELTDKLDNLDNKLNVANIETPSQLTKSLRKGGCGSLLSQRILIVLSKNEFVIALS